MEAVLEADRFLFLDFTAILSAPLPPRTREKSDDVVGLVTALAINASIELTMPRERAR
jgi:hypothetical protein